MAALVFRVAGSMLIVDSKHPTTQLPSCPSRPARAERLVEVTKAGWVVFLRPAQSPALMQGPECQPPQIPEIPDPSRFFG